MKTLVFNGYPHLRRYSSGSVPGGVIAKGDKVGDKVSDGVVVVSDEDAAVILADHPHAFVELEGESKPAAEGAKKGK